MAINRHTFKSPDIDLSHHMKEPDSIKIAKQQTSQSAKQLKESREQTNYSKRTFKWTVGISVMTLLILALTAVLVLIEFEII